MSVLEDWDDELGDWATSGAEWARRLGVSPSTIHMLRRGETWEHLNHPNQGRRKKERASSNGNGNGTHHTNGFTNVVASENGHRRNGRGKSREN
jgi:uncharacterized protein YjcR